jgi:hypothetical protein
LEYLKVLEANEAFFKTGMEFDIAVWAKMRTTSTGNWSALDYATNT